MYLSGAGFPDAASERREGADFLICEQNPDLALPTEYRGIPYAQTPASPATTPLSYD
jgi:hypothetical protein